MSSATPPATMIVFNRAAPRVCGQTATWAGSLDGGSRRAGYRALRPVNSGSVGVKGISPAA